MLRNYSPERSYTNLPPHLAAAALLAANDAARLSLRTPCCAASTRRATVRSAWLARIQLLASRGALSGRDCHGGTAWWGTACIVHNIDRPKR